MRRPDYHYVSTLHQPPPQLFHSDLDVHRYLNNIRRKQKEAQCTAGHEGAIGDLSCMSIFSACFGLPTTVQLPATTWSGQIWISCWILRHFDVRTISVAWKLKKLSNIFWQNIFFLLNPLSKGVAPLCTVDTGQWCSRWRHNTLLSCNCKWITQQVSTRMGEIQQQAVTVVFDRSAGSVTVTSNNCRLELVLQNLGNISCCIIVGLCFIVWLLDRGYSGIQHGGNLWQKPSAI